jgi:hypothetical protein
MPRSQTQQVARHMSWFPSWPGTTNQADAHFFIATLMLELFSTCNNGPFIPAIGTLVTVA